MLRYKQESLRLILPRMLEWIIAYYRMELAESKMEGQATSLAARQVRSAPARTPTAPPGADKNADELQEAPRLLR